MDKQMERGEDGKMMGKMSDSQREKKLGLKRVRRRVGKEQERKKTNSGKSEDRIRETQRDKEAAREI